MMIAFNVLDDAVKMPLLSDRVLSVVVCVVGQSAPPLQSSYRRLALVAQKSSTYMRSMLAVAFLARGVRAFAPRAKPTRLVGRALAAGGDMPADDEGWRTELSPNQFAVLRNKATEPAGFSETTEGELEHELKKDFGTKYPQLGAYECAGCGAELYYARAKFDSGCGWPAFYDGVPGAIEEVPDVDGYRVEIVCAKCKGHLGHVFKGEGFPSPTDARHCVNGISLRYQPTSYQPDDVEALPAQFVPRADPSGLS